jgi:hypothetical protein
MGHADCFSKVTAHTMVGSEANDAAATPRGPNTLTRWLPRAVAEFRLWLDRAFGCLSIIVGLALLSVAPLLNFLSLGYLIHASGRVASTGRLRDGFVGVQKASRLGNIAIGVWLVLLPVRFVSGLWKDAALIAPHGAVSRRWWAALVVLAVLAGLQITWACANGGGVFQFLRPAPIRLLRWVRGGHEFEQTWRTVVRWVASLRLPYYFWLGFRGALGTLLWLGLPVGLLFAASQLPPDKGGGLLSLAGGLLLMPAAIHLPFLQARFGVENRFSAFFEVGAIRSAFTRAPVAFLVAMAATLVFSVPLYLLKIELPPRELTWLPSLFFVVFIFPARLLTGWAVGRAFRRETPRHWFFRWSSRLGLLPVALFYALLVYGAQYLSWSGTVSLVEQHAFLFPAPLPR